MVGGGSKLVNTTAKRANPPDFIANGISSVVGGFCSLVIVFATVVDGVGTIVGVFARVVNAFGSLGKAFRLNGG